MATFYVSTDGSDGGSGSASSPWRTINHAVHAEVGAGDRIIVRSGTYVEQVWINRGGSAAGDLTIKSEVPGGAHVIAPSGSYSAINIRGSYVTLDGFKVKGAEGHAIDGEGVHHVTVTNNTAHDSGGSGISFQHFEFIRIEGNEVYANASTNGYQTSGISIYQARNITGDTTTPGFRAIVKDNVSYNNSAGPAMNFDHTDGNGIIVDDFQSTQATGHPSYGFPTLVEGNLVFGNGGKGIQVTWSDHVTVRNNTAYHNNTDPMMSSTWRGELSNAQSSDNTWVNNIAVADPSTNSNNTAIGNYSYGGYKNAGVTWENNLTYNGTVGEPSVKTDGGNPAPSAAGGNQLGVDPRFVDPENGDFHLASDSPAINGGTGAHGLASEDLDGGPRVVGKVDMGAYESASSTGEPEDPAEPTILRGTSRADVLTGGDGDDSLFGQKGNDTLHGGAGDDMLRGGPGKDLMFGDAGSDTFEFGRATVGVVPDEIRSFSQAEGDRIDLREIDADTGRRGNQRFDMIGSDPFSGDAGELRYSGGMVFGDVDGDGDADFRLMVASKTALDSEDFLL